MKKKTTTKWTDIPDGQTHLPLCHPYKCKKYFNKKKKKKNKVPSTKLFEQELQISRFNISNVCGINSLLY